MYESLYPKICIQNEEMESKLKQLEEWRKQFDEQYYRKNKAIDYLNDKIKYLE